LELLARLEPTSAWREISAELRRIVGDSTYELWLEPLQATRWDGTVLSLHAPAATRAWVTKRFGRVVESCAQTVIDPTVKVAFTDGTVAEQVGGPPPHAPDLDLVAPFNPRYSFDQFIIGDGNRLAHAAALTVAELPGQTYNPLFLHAPPGLGKTHLLHAIGNYIAMFGGGTRVRYTTVEAFTNHFISALSTRNLSSFKQAYRATDVLLIDDVQFLASKAKTEEEFFHTFNALYETGRQLVLTCDRLPRQLTSVEDRLRERFDAGLVADIQPPDFATRVAILRKRAALDNITLPDPSVLELIAGRVTDNVRHLEGALIRIVAYHSLTRKPIDHALASTVLDRAYPAAEARSLTVDDIQRFVAAWYDLSVTELTSASRAARVAWPRHLAIFLARELTRSSLTAIGSAFGGRNHATVVHACKRVSDRASAESTVAAQIAELTAALRYKQDDRQH
jgi:chromosomal replication initiator protein